MAKACLNQVELAYHTDSAPLFALLRGMPYAAFLDSSQHGFDVGRFDILCADPSHILTSEGERTFLTSSGGKRKRLHTDPFDALQKLLKDQGFDGVALPDLPFCGGALGYFGYDLGRRYESFDSIACRDIDIPDMQVGIYTWAIIVDHQKRRARLVSHTMTCKALRHLLGRLAPIASEPFRLSASFESNMSRNAYRKRFRQVIDYIQAGDCYQVNLAQRFSCDYQGDPWHAYLKLRARTKTPFSAFLEYPEGCLLSLSPERFLQVDRGMVQTRPIKGTRSRHIDKDIDQKQKNALLNSGKDRAENLMIVDLLRNDLGRICTVGSVKVPTLFEIESYTNVHHMVSTITGKLHRPIDIVSLLGSCFPGGSITGAPKIRAMQVIEQLEPHRRSVYCGSVGYIGFNGQMDSNICIRTLVATRKKTTSPLLVGNKIYCWAGGGIVADSICENEYQETFDKVNNLIKGLEEGFLKENRMDYCR